MSTKPLHSQAVAYVAISLSAALALALGALWLWQNAAWEARAMASPRPDVLRDGIRCAAVMLAALAQWVVLQQVIGRLYRIQAGDRFAARAAQVVAAAAGVSAAALYLASR